MAEKKKTFKEKVKAWWKDHEEEVRLGAGIGMLTSVAYMAGLLKGTAAGIHNMGAVLEKVPNAETSGLDDPDKALFRGLKGTSKKEVDVLMDEMIRYGDMRP